MNKHKKFTVTSGYIASHPGTHTACGYLYRASAPTGTVIMKSKTYKVA